MEVEIKMLEKIRKKLKPYKNMNLTQEELEYLGRKYLAKQHWDTQKTKLDIIKFITL